MGIAYCHRPTIPNPIPAIVEIPPERVLELSTTLSLESSILNAAAERVEATIATAEAFFERNPPIEDPLNLSNTVRVFSAGLIRSLSACSKLLLFNKAFLSSALNPFNCLAKVINLLESVIPVAFSRRIKSAFCSVSYLLKKPLNAWFCDVPLAACCAVCATCCPAASALAVSAFALIVISTGFSLSSFSFLFISLIGPVSACIIFCPLCFIDIIIVASIEITVVGILPNNFGKVLALDKKLFIPSKAVLKICSKPELA